MEKEVLLNQFIEEYLKRTIPSQNGTMNFLSLSLNKDLKWTANVLNEGGLFNKDGRLGIGREPLHNYRVDIAVPKDTLMTALHIGDGSYGFSLGNGTKQGFVPEIIGISSDCNDPGLYFLGIAGNDETSSTPLLVFDGRNVKKQSSSNRPILGIKSGEKDYDLVLDSLGNLIIKNDIILGTSSLLSIIEDLRTQIKELEIKINENK